MKAIVLSALLATLTFSVYASDGRDSNTPSRLRISADLARFRGDSAAVYVELYYAFDVSKLSFVKKGSLFEADVIMNIYFRRSANDSVVSRQAWRIPFSTSDSTILGTPRYYVDVLGFLLKPDIYRLFIVARDFHDVSQRDSSSVALDLKPIDTKQIALSDVELCSSIVAVEKDSLSRFIKNTYEVRPNPSRIFGASQPVVFYYLESYNLLKNSTPSYFTRITINNSVGKEVYSSEKAKRRVNESNVEVGTVKVNQLRTGAYTFNFMVIDSADNSSSVSSKKLFIYNPLLPLDTMTTGTQGSVLASEYATMPESDLDREFDIVRYIATREEIAQYRNIKGVEAKRKLLFDFWNKRDEDPLTPGNEQKTEYLKRVEYSNTHFKTGFREGWKTDRGRVFIVYGPPDEVERHANEVDTKPYEIWSYNSIQGGVQFIFGDRSGFSDYILLHSTHRDELHDENWMRQIQVQQ